MRMECSEIMTGNPYIERSRPARFNFKTDLKWMFLSLHFPPVFKAGGNFTCPPPPPRIQNTCTESLHMVGGGWQFIDWYWIRLPCSPNNWQRKETGPAKWMFFASRREREKFPWAIKYSHKDPLFGPRFIDLSENKYARFSEMHKIWAPIPAS